MSKDLLKGVFYNFQQNHQILPEQVGIKAGANSKEVEQNKTGGREWGVWNYGCFYVVCFSVLGAGHLRRHIGMFIKQWPLLELA